MVGKKEKVVEEGLLTEGLLTEGLSTFNKFNDCHLSTEGQGVKCLSYSCRRLSVISTAAFKHHALVGRETVSGLITLSYITSQISVGLEKRTSLQ